MTGNGDIAPGRSLMIVGAASGIGRALTPILLSRGLEVLAVDRNGALLETIPNDGEGLLETIRLDMTDRSSVSGLACAMAEKGRSLNGLVITAGVHSTHPVQHLSDELVDRVLDVNLASHIKLVRDFLPLVNDGGSIIGVSSIAACVGVPMSSMYSASSADLRDFTSLSPSR